MPQESVRNTLLNIFSHIWAWGTSDFQLHPNPMLREALCGHSHTASFHFPCISWFFRDRNISKCLRDTPCSLIQQVLGLGDQDMAWNRAEPQCQLNGVATCADLAFRGIGVNANKKMGMKVYKPFNVCYFLWLLESKKCSSNIHRWAHFTYRSIKIEKTPH